MSDTNTPVMLVGLGRDSQLPLAQTAGAAAMDLHAAEDRDLSPGRITRVPLGISVAIPRGHCGLIVGRSGLALKGILAHTGIIDEDYRGELQALLINTGENTYGIGRGDRVAQLLIVPYVMPALEPRRPEDLPATDRATGGFGSTGA